MPELSVIVPVYNTGAILKQSINAILNQSYQDFELILVDDGSTDNSGLLCDEIASTDRKVKVIHKVNGGAGSARNAGIEHAVGKYITFPDADDFCKPDMFQKLLQSTKNYDFDLIICSYESVKVDVDGNRSDIQPQKLFNAEFKDIEMVRKCWFEIRSINISLLNTPWNKIYKKEIIDQYHIRFPDLRRAQDAVFNLLYYDHVGSLKVVDECLYQYNANDVVRVGKKFPKDVYQCFIEYNRVMEEVITGWGMYRGEYKALCDNNLLGNLDSCVELCDNPVWKLTTDEKIAYLNNLMASEYLYRRLTEYSGNVEEIEDIIEPLLERNPKSVLKTLEKRNKIEQFKRSALGKILIAVKHRIC